MMPVENRAIGSGFQAVFLPRHQRLSQYLGGKAIELGEFCGAERPIPMERQEWDKIAHRHILGPE